MLSNSYKNIVPTKTNDLQKINDQQMMILHTETNRNSQMKKNKQSHLTNTSSEQFDFKKSETFIQSSNVVNDMSSCGGGGVVGYQNDDSKQGESPQEIL